MGDIYKLSNSIVNKGILFLDFNIYLMGTYLFKSKYQKSYSSFLHRETIPIIFITEDRFFSITLYNFYITKRSPYIFPTSEILFIHALKIKKVKV